MPAARSKRFCAKCGEKTARARKSAHSSAVSACAQCLTPGPVPLTRGKRECPGASCAKVLSTKCTSCSHCGWLKYGSNVLPTAANAHPVPTVAHAHPVPTVEHARTVPSVEGQKGVPSAHSLQHCADAITTTADFHTANATSFSEHAAGEAHVKHDGESGGLKRKNDGVNDEVRTALHL